jgi:hypothetical protein
MIRRYKGFFEGTMENLRRNEHCTGPTIARAGGSDWSE